MGFVVVLLGGAFLATSAQKRVTLVVDGQVFQVRSTSFSVGQLLARRGIQIDGHDRVTPAPGSRLRDGLRVVVNHASEIALVLDGRRRMVPLPLGTPSVLLALRSAKVSVDRDDLVRPGLDSVPHSGMTVHVTKVSVREVSRVEAVPFATVSRYDPNMAMGTSRVERPGTPGQEFVTYRIRSEAGRVVERRVLATQMYSLPRDEYVVVGTHSRERQATWQQGESSWYERPGVGAAHRWLPKGTEVTVTNLETGAQITVIIDDRGPYGVAGRILDLSKEAFARLAPLGQGVFPVEIEW